MVSNLVDQFSALTIASQSTDVQQEKKVPDKSKKNGWKSDFDDISPHLASNFRGDDVVAQQEVYSIQLLTGVATAIPGLPNELIELILSYQENSTLYLINEAVHRTISKMIELERQWDTTTVRARKLEIGSYIPGESCSIASLLSKNEKYWKKACIKITNGGDFYLRYLVPFRKKQLQYYERVLPLLSRTTQLDFSKFAVDQEYVISLAGYLLVNTNSDFFSRLVMPLHVEPSCWNFLPCFSTEKEVEKQKQLLSARIQRYLPRAAKPKITYVVKI